MSESGRLVSPSWDKEAVYWGSVCLSGSPGERAMYLRPAGAGTALVGCWGRKGLQRRPASLLGFLLCPEGGGNLARPPVFSGATGRVSGSPGDLEGRARLCRRWVGSGREGDSGDIPSQPSTQSVAGQHPGTNVFLDEIYSMLS